MKSLITRSLAALCLILMVGCSSNGLEGKWQYDGGIYNGKSRNAATEFLMQRTYKADTYEAFLLEGAAKPELYNSGKYEIKGDSILITSTFSTQPSQNDNMTVAYKFKLEGDKMTTNGVLPNGMIVEEYWKRVK
ncbi:MAG: lipocalin family protein [Daejeonella sp.]|uniref:lipocalin family protein n=1 Tax=Daejeonella sp. TaxID=2805397 RepID=UPI003C787017